MGTAPKTATDSAKVTLGYRPSFIMYYNMYITATSTLYHSIILWESFLRPNLQLYSYSNNMEIAMPNPGNIYTLSSVDNDGFTVNRSGVAAMKEIRYFVFR